MKRDFDADAVRALLGELARRLEDRGIRGTIRVAGGAQCSSGFRMTRTCE